MHLEFSREERVWLRLKWQKVRESSAKADDYNNKWKRLNEEINSYLDREGIRDIVQRAHIKGQSLPLADALDSGKWHSANASRHCDDINTFLRLREVGAI